MTLKTAILMAVGSTAVTVGAALFLGVNRLLWFIGVSTVAVDAPGAAAGFVDLLLIIASWNPWVLGAIAAFALGWQVWMVFQIIRFMDEGRKAID
ncbi:MAG TPA: hypothetical protein VIN77_06850, partial [Aurantimonas sp.]